MRLLLFSLIIFATACNQKKDKAKTEPIKDSADSAVTVERTKAPETTAAEPVAPGNPTTAEENAVNAALSERYGDEWRVLNDKSASWMKDAFDYFIVPKRKEYPNYPYITMGDFNADGKPDTAAVIRNDTRTEFQIAILTGTKDLIFWKEDILDDAAIHTLVKPGQIEGMDGDNIEKIKKVKTKGDGIVVDYFEKASFVLYWDKGRFKRIQTSD